MRNALSHRIARVAAACLLIGLLSPSIALGQALKEQLVGAWKLVSIYNEENGVKRHLFGENPAGLLVFDRSGYVIQHLARPDLPKFAAANRLKGTDKEYREVMQGLISGFGTYAIEGENVVIKWIASSFPNRSGTSEKRIYKVNGNNLISTNPTAASGGTSYAAYERAN